MPIAENMTAEEQIKYKAYREEAKAVRESGAGNWSEKRDANSGTPMKPFDLLMTNEFLTSYAKKLDDVFKEG